MFDLHQRGVFDSHDACRTGRKVRVSLPGGDLRIDWRESDSHVLMTGPVEFEFEGRFDPALFAKVGAAKVGAT